MYLKVLLAFCFSGFVLSSENNAEEKPFSVEVCEILLRLTR